MKMQLIFVISNIKCDCQGLNFVTRVTAKFGNIFQMDEHYWFL